MDRRLTIGQLAETVGVPRKTIRHYEEVGVLPTPARSGAGYRLYTDLDVRRLELVRRARWWSGPGLGRVATSRVVFKR